jgi:hypothetical protein
MIVTQLNGGLGNQLFQYAIARMLARNNGTHVVLDVSLYQSYKLRNYSLQYFLFNKKIAKKHHLKLFGKISIANKTERIYYKLLRKIYTPLTIAETSLAYNTTITKTKNTNIYLEGYWQSEKYFADIRHQLLTDLTITVPLQGLNLTTATLIQKTNAVALHIRRGDYVTNAHTLSVHGVCSLAYYERAIQHIINNVQNPKLFIFSDDMQWVKQNLKTTLPIHYIDNNDASTDYEDLRLMSLCKHNIIANSSFSWWGAWLNTNKNKIVIAPNNWFTSSELNSADIIPTTWIQL